jgi:hypothetical protein
MPVRRRPAIPTIACVNHATVPLGVDFRRMVSALHRFNRDYFAPIWGTPARLVVSRRLVPGAWGLVFLDTSDEAGFLGYHDLTPDGNPLGKVFVKTTLADGQKVSVTACHELCEMLVDPTTSLCVCGPDGSTMYAYETADPVEEQEFPVDGIPMSNFVYPSWFESYHRPGSVRFDHLGSVRRPFQLMAGGYMQVLKKGQWTQLHGSKKKAKARAKEDRRGRRFERRSARAQGKPLRRSKPKPG